jgi:protein TonB
MQALRRAALPLVNSFIITTALFGFMYSLIYIQQPELSTSVSPPVIKIIQIPKDEPPKLLLDRPEPPKQVEPKPTSPRDTEILMAGNIDATVWDPYRPAPTKVGGSLPIDNQLVIAIGFPPEYPVRALTNGIEGYAIVGFSVSAAGSVINSTILESAPRSVFDRSSLKAISKFKYKARMVNGRPVSTDGQRYMFSFKLDQ